MFTAEILFYTKILYTKISSCSPSFPFPHPINPMAYQQLLSQQRGLSAFGHTPPLIQPPPTFTTRQGALGLSSLPASTHNSDLVSKVKGQGFDSTSHHFLHFIAPRRPAFLCDLSCPLQYRRKKLIYRNERGVCAKGSCSVPLKPSNMVSHRDKCKNQCTLF